jgi:integrative and conjugative element protein (TIGR02256 family)
VSIDGRLLFARPRRGVVVISAKVVAVIEAYRQRGWCSPEGGGVLLGRLMEGADDVMVDEATTPTGFDRAGRFFFRRARAPAQQRIREAWRETAGTRNYLGEWHTHPEPDPSPSGHDMADWLRLCSGSTFEQDFLLFLILGQRSIGVWELSTTDKTSVRCHAR